MAEIKILPDSLINKIAAGEVVERPASVVKELVENSLDSGADEISVIVELGGKKKIRVIDNGGGMGGDDLMLSIERHATSKIEKESDLWNIHSMGFRGEALPSIASVSRMKITSALAGSEGGNCLKIDGGKILDFSPVAAPKGTDVEVSQLFYNVPVRRKFLKTTNTELQHLVRSVGRSALSRPHVRFKLEHNGRVLINVPKKQRMIDRIAGIYGANLSRKLIEVSGCLDRVKVSGYLGSLEAVRNNRSEQLIFINGRYVKDRVVSKAVYAAYGNLVPKGGHPVWIIFIEVDPNILDVNVHPTKTEVRIADYNLVYQAVLELLDRALKGVNLAPEVSISCPESPSGRSLSEGNILKPLGKPSGAHSFEKRSSVERSEAVQQSLKEFLERVKSPASHPYDYQDPEKTDHSSEKAEAGKDGKIITGETKREKTALDGNDKDKVAEDQNNSGGGEGFFNSLKVIGQYAGCFLFCQYGGELVVIDQHAAHERIRYEKIKKSFQNKKVTGQTLMFPAVVEFPAEKSLIMEENVEIFKSLGFDISPFGKTTYMVRQLPVEVETAQVKKLILDLVDALAEGKAASDSLDELRENMIAALACHSSVRANRELNDQEIKSLLSQMGQASQPYTCPHGRPTVVRVSQGEVRKWFYRDGK